MIDFDALRADRAAGTPGPWRLSTLDKTAIVCLADGWPIATAQGDRNDGDEAHIMDADARRIARIPDLEDEVLRLRAFIEEFIAAKFAPLPTPHFKWSEDKPDPATDAMTVWAWQEDARALITREIAVAAWNRRAPITVQEAARVLLAGELPQDAILAAVREHLRRDNKTSPVAIRLAFIAALQAIAGDSHE